MKRPLCLVSLLFAAVLALLLYQEPPEAFVFDGKEGGRITVTGKVGQKEYGPQGGILWLTDITDYSAESAQNPRINQNNNQDNQRNHLNSRPPEGILCYFPDEAMPKTGQYVSLTGRARSLRHVMNPGAFDQEAYYRVQGVELQLMDCSVVRAVGEGNSWKEALFSLRCRLEKILYENLKEEQASVLSAMLLGSKKRLDSEVKELYQASGIAHILAISGLHISFLGMLLLRLLRRLGCPAKIAALLCLPLLYSYGVLTGAGASGLRALCMFSLQLGAVLVGRTYDMITALAAAAILLLAEQPLYLFSGSFQLSFGAILGLGLIYPALRNEKRRTNQERRAAGRVCAALSDSLLAGGSVMLMTLPVLLRNFYEFAPWSLLLNLVVIPLTGLLLPAGFALMAAGSLCPVLAPLPALICRGILAVLTILCRVALTLPGSRVCTGYVPDWQTAAYFMLLFVACCGKRRNVLKSVLLGSALLVLFLRLPAKPLQVHMVDVGQGDCFFLQARGEYALIDGGSSSEKKIGHYQIAPLLRYYGVTCLDYVFVTHLDADHYNGIEELLEMGTGEQPEVMVRNLVLPAVLEGEEKAERLTELVKAQGGRVYGMEAGDELWLGEARLRCLHPLSGERVSDSNDASLVLSVEYGSFRGLFTGDLSIGHEKELLDVLEESGGEDMRYTLLKAGHHGSADATGEELLQRLRPSLVLLSYGQNNSYGHPHADTMARLERSGAQLFATAQCGEVTVSTDGEKVWIRSFALQP